MRWFKVASIAMLAHLGLASAQTDLSKDPRLRQTVDMRYKRVMLSELAPVFAKQVKEKVFVEPKIEHCMVCIFANGQPVWKLMQGVADVLGCEWIDQGSQWRLSETKMMGKNLGAYVDAENALREDDVLRQQDALAQIARAKPWSEVGMGPISPPSVTKTETPEQWAARVCHDPAYYIAGMMFARMADTPYAWAWKCDGGGGLRNTWLPMSYRLSNTPQEIPAKFMLCGPTGAFGSGLDGEQLFLRNLLWAGTIQSVLVDGHSHRAEKPARLVTYPRPEGRLDKTPAGRWILDWETALDDVKDSFLDAAVPREPLEASPFYKGGRGIEEYLEWLSDSTGVPVICDGFRAPVLVNSGPSTRKSIRSWLAELRTNEGCFLKVDNGSLLVRHGGFWDLQTREPSEVLIRQLEAVKKPSLNDYADFAFVVCSEGDYHLNSYSVPLFDCRQIPLTRFDPTPLQENICALAAFGQMDAAQRGHILSGGSVDVRRNIHLGTTLDRRPVYAPINNKVVHVGDEVTVRELAAGSDRFLATNPFVSLFYGGFTTGIEGRLLEGSRMPYPFRSRWGDTIGDPEVAREANDLDYGFSHYLTLYHGEGAITEAFSAEHPVGGFSFFCSLNEKSGVVNTVTIPGEK